MCGLVTIKRFDGLPCSKMVEKRYKRQSTRGQEGFGFVSLKGGVVEDFRKSETEEPIIKALKETRGDEVMFHHRKPSSTENLWEAAHPIQVSNAKLKHDYYMIHNGSIKEFEKLREGHEKDGYKYNTLIQYVMETQSGRSVLKEEKWNDSEAYAIELARDLDNEQVGLPDLSGNIAFIMYQVDKTTKKAVKLFWGRNIGSPLKFDKNDRFLILASEGGGKDVDPQTLNCYDYATGEVTSKRYTVGYSVVTSTYPRGVGFYETHHWDYEKRDYVPNKPEQASIPDVPPRSVPVVHVPSDREIVLLADKKPIISDYARNPKLDWAKILDSDVDELMSLHTQITEINRQLREDTLDDIDKSVLKTMKSGFEDEMTRIEKKYPIVGGDNTEKWPR